MAPADETVLTNISEMIDLAIGTPEVGVVDFCMLQTVLHCLAQQLRVLGKNVELRGSIAAMPVGRQMDNAQTIAISEFIVDTESPGKYELATEPPSADQESMLVVERRRKNDPQVYAASQGVGSTQPTPSGGKSAGGPSTPASTATSAMPVRAASTPGAVASSPGAVASSPGAVPSTPGAVTSATGAVPSAPGAVTSASGAVPSATAQAAAGQAGAPTAASVTAPYSQLRTTTSGSPPQRGPSLEKLSLVTMSKFNLLENTVADLKDRVYGTSPKNEEILQEVRSQSNLKAITDMWTNMNVSSRLEAAEEGIKKLSSLVEDLIAETAKVQKKIGATPSSAATAKSETATGISKSAVPPAAPQHAQFQHEPSPPGSVPPGTVAPGTVPPGTVPPGTVPPGTVSPGTVPPGTVAPGTVPYAPPPDSAAVYPSPSMIESWRLEDAEKFASKDELMQLLGHLQSIRDDLDNLTKSFADAMKDVNPTFVAPTPPPPSKIEIMAPPPRSPPHVVVVPPSHQTQPTAINITYAPPTGQQLPEPSPAQNRAAINQIEGQLLDKLAQMERELRRCCDAVRKTEATVKDQLSSFQDQLEELEKQTSSSGLGAAGNLSPDVVKDLQGLMKLFETVQNMQVQLQQVHETALNLAGEKEERQNHIDALLEQIELLKVIKLDREDMVEALADKADLRMLARKVSHDQFENACDDLSKGLEHALGKLNVQESLWQQALDDIQREIEQKLDKMELSPVKDFFNSKLKQLQDNLKAMAALRREAEAAGTKRRLLRDVNCISCDAKAVMAMDPPPPQAAKPLPANLSMKPYLSYELDAIRKTQASSLPQRNMHDWEHVQQQMQPTKPHKVRSDTDKHLCNRYCGGSHTVTTPAQRVARLGHFIKQWGPEVLPLSSGFAAGDDGRLYKISTSEGASVGPGGAIEGAPVCSPKSPAKKPPPPSGPKPIIISAECRCLDPTAEHPPPKN